MGKALTRREKKLKTQTVPTIFSVYEKQLYVTTAESLDELRVKKFRSDHDGDHDKNNKKIENIEVNQVATIGTSNENSDKSTNINERAEDENYLHALFVDNSTLCDQLTDYDIHSLSSPTNNVNSNNSSDSINVSAATSSTSNVTPVTLERALEQMKVFEQKLQNKNIEVNQLQNKLKNANKVLRKVEKSNKTLVKRVRRLRSMKRLRIEKSVLQSRQLLQKVFNNDQIEWLQSQCIKRRVYTWSKETIKKALRIKFSCTNAGYKELIKQNIPLPSTRTLRQSLQNVNFTPGILDDIFDAMKNKVQLFEDHRQYDCMIGVDEMALTPGEQLDPCTNSIVGSSTIPNSRGNFYTVS